jgi:uncharacterized membrane protein YhaH (DUF805 family)
VKAIPLWLVLSIFAFLLLALLAALRHRASGRSALYSLACRAQRAICLAASLLPTIALVVEGLPDNFRIAWAAEKPREDERLRVFRKSA